MRPQFHIAARKPPGHYCGRWLPMRWCLLFPHSMHRSAFVCSVKSLFSYAFPGWSCFLMCFSIKILSTPGLHLRSAPFWRVLPWRAARWHLYQTRTYEPAQRIRLQLRRSVHGQLNRMWSDSSLCSHQARNWKRFWETSRSTLSNTVVAQIALCASNLHAFLPTISMYGRRAEVPRSHV